MAPQNENCVIAIPAESFDTIIADLDRQAERNRNEKGDVFGASGVAGETRTRLLRLCREFDYHVIEDEHGTAPSGPVWRTVARKPIVEAVGDRVTLEGVVAAIRRLTGVPLTVNCGPRMTPESHGRSSQATPSPSSSSKCGSESGPPFAT
jgi:hypothetical protein